MASTTDALRAPIPQGNKRARVVDERVKDAVAAASSSGAFGRSSSKVLTAMGRMRTRKFHLKPQTGNKFDTSRVARYWKAGQKLFRGIHGSVLSVVMDATRVSKKDMLFSAAFCPHVCQGLWLPPQVPFFVVAAGRKQRATRRRKPPETRRRKTHGARQITPETAPNRRKTPESAPNRTKPPETRTAANRTKPPETAGKRTQLLKVLPDLRLRAQDAGEDIGTADCDEWATFQRHFFSDTWHSVAAAKAKATAKAAKAKAKGKARALATTAAGRRPASQAQTWQRKSAYRQMRTLDYLLFLLLGEGLSRFSPSPTTSPVEDRPLLVLHLDEGSPGYAMCWYLAYHIKYRVVFVGDILHREWNDCTLALRQAGLWWVVLLTTVVFNFPFGPWNGAAWWQKLLEGSNEYFSLEQWDNPLFKTMYPHICRDRGEAPVGAPEHMQLILRETADSEAFRKKGEKTALRRWFSWMGASHFHDRVWHARLCVLYSIAMRLGLYRGFEETPLWGGPHLVAPLRAPDSDEPAASTADKAAATTLAQTAKAAAASDAPAKS